MPAETIQQELIGSDPRAFTREPQHLTRELLRSLTAALEAVLVTPEVHAVMRGRPEASLVDALKNTDKLWPYALGGADVLTMEAQARDEEAGEASGRGAATAPGDFEQDGRSGHWADGRPEG